ncbi:hypothetical protein [Alishewanella longhuensis]
MTEDENQLALAEWFIGLQLQPNAYQALQSGALVFSNLSLAG